MPKRMGEVRITAPVPGSCPVCAVKHDKDDPHDLNSLYWQNRFYKGNRRFPTWADALKHCSPESRAMWVERLKNAGIEVVFPEDGAEAPEKP